MKKILLPACLIAAISLSACGGEPPRYDTNDEAAALSNPVPPADSSANIFLDPNAAAGSQQALPAASAKTTAALNPAHGLPGHRCDIAVGAPLDMPAQELQTAPQMAPPPPPLPPANTGGSAKLNPAHGQPGHDCAIPVGQPLRS